MSITAIILTYNEEIHLSRCLSGLNKFCNEIIIIDSFSNDKTLEIAKSYNAKIFQHTWVNYSNQFNWGLANSYPTSQWILRIDADEYLTNDLIHEIKDKLLDLPSEVTGIVFKRRHIFLKRWIKNGVYPIKLLRLFRYKKGICEQRWMDEHIQLNEGTFIEFEHDFVDHNLNNLTWWSKKHIDYTIREAIDLLDIELGLLDCDVSNLQLNSQAANKRKKKMKYAKQPLFWRTFAYFIYRYIFKFGFLEGMEGFLWHFLQGWWYRTLVDAKIYEIKKACGTDKEKIKAYLKKEYSIEI